MPFVWFFYFSFSKIFSFVQNPLYISIRFFFVNFFEYSNFSHLTWLYNSQIHIGDTYIDMTSTSITFYIGTFTEIYGEIQMSRMSTYTITNVLFKVNPNRARINHISVYLQNEANQPYFFFWKKKLLLFKLCFFMTQMRLYFHAINWDKLRNMIRT